MVLWVPFFIRHPIWISLPSLRRPLTFCLLHLIARSIPTATWPPLLEPNAKQNFNWDRVIFLSMPSFYPPPLYVSLLHRPPFLFWTFFVQSTSFFFPFLEGSFFTSPQLGLLKLSFKSSFELDKLSTSFVFCEGFSMLKGLSISPFQVPDFSSPKDFVLLNPKPKTLPTIATLVILSTSIFALVLRFQGLGFSTPPSIYYAHGIKSNLQY